MGRSADGFGVPTMTKTATGWFCDLCSKEFDTQRGRDFHMRRWCPENPDADRPGEKNLVPRKASEPVDDPVDDSVETIERPPVDPASPYDEAPPVEPPSWRERFWGKGSNPKIVAPQTMERKPRKRRTPTDGVWTTLWTVVGAGLTRTGADVPVGNAMQFQAPVVGGVLDEAIKGTFIDTLVQPIAGSGDRLKKVSAVVSMPVLVGVMERSPNSAAMLEPLLRQVIREHLTAMAPVIRQQRKQEVEYRKALDELGIEQGEDPVDDVIAAIWAGAPPAPEPAMNGQAEGADVHP